MPCPVQAIGSPSWKRDADFANHESRRSNHDALDERISAMSTQRARYSRVS